MVLRDSRLRPNCQSFISSTFSLLNGIPENVTFASKVTESVSATWFFHDAIASCYISLCVCAAQGRCNNSVVRVNTWSAILNLQSHYSCSPKLTQEGWVFLWALVLIVLQSLSAVIHMGRQFCASANSAVQAFVCVCVFHFSYHSVLGLFWVQTIAQITACDWKLLVTWFTQNQEAQTQGKSSQSKFCSRSKTSSTLEFQWWDNVNTIWVVWKDKKSK